MQKITKLTPEQEAKIPQYINTWVQKGLTSKRCTLSEAIIDFNTFQTEVLKSNQTPVIILDSPIECWTAVMMFSDRLNQVDNQVDNQVWNQVMNQVWNQVWNQVENQVKNQVKNQVWNQVENQVMNQVMIQVMNQVGNQVRNQVRNQVGNQVKNQVWNQVENQVMNQVWNQVENQVRNQVANQVWNQVGNQVWNQVRNQVWNQVENQVGNQVRNQVDSKRIVYPFFDGQFWAGWASFYEFMYNELDIQFQNKKPYDAFINCLKYGMVWPLENICIVCQPPTFIKKNSRGLHCEDGPALSYNGNNEIYALNGVTVPKELVMTNEEDLSLEFFKNQNNADVKAEFVRKYGVERMLDFGTKVDQYLNYDEDEHEWWYKSQYELWDMKNIFEGLDYQPYLKMVNQTTGVFHVEAVSPVCRTLKDAIKERFGGRELKIIAIA